jgi:hypothetical protein
MSEHPAERWNAASGYLVILLGIAGTAFERGSPPLTAPIEEVAAFWSMYQRELLAQSVMFVLSAGAYLWFFASLRGVLLQAEGGTGTLSTVAFGAGIVSAGLQMIQHEAEFESLKVSFPAGRLYWRRSSAARMAPGRRARK